MSDIQLPYLVHSGGRSDLELKRSGYGEFPNGYELTPWGLAEVAKWMKENQSQDPEDCATCTVLAAGNHGNYCPYHDGFIGGSSYVVEEVKNHLEEI